MVVIDLEPSELAPLEFSNRSRPRILCSGELGQCLAIKRPFLGFLQIKELNTGEWRLEMRMTIKPPHPLKIFCLTMTESKHVYLPLVRDELLLLDRNLMFHLSSSHRFKSAAVQYWLREFERVSRNINPIMTAYEGAVGRQPTRLEFQLELVKAHDRLRLLYPHKNIIEHSSAVSGQLFDALSSKRSRQLEEIEFLRQNASVAAHRPSDKELMPRIRQVLDAAGAAGLLRHSLVHIALISCLAENRHGDKPSSGRRVIKPRPDYTERHAHNAVSDVHLLEFLIASNAYPFGPVALCTMDEGLAQFWIELRVSHSSRSESNDINFRFTIDKRLFPRLSEGQLEEVRQATN
jgi:hypothetical protein